MTAKRIRELVDGGEWACSWGEPTGLREVCKELATMTAPRFAKRALRIADLTEGDLWTAIEEWGELVALLRQCDRPEQPLPQNAHSLRDSRAVW